MVRASFPLPSCPTGERTLLPLFYHNRPRYGLILTEAQRAKAIKRWPETKKTIDSEPSGIVEESSGKRTLHAWAIHTYNERGVSCRFLTGILATFTPKVGAVVKRTHKYAAGRRMGRPCGTPLPQ